MKELLALAAMLPLAAFGETGYYVVTTYDVEGQASIDYKYWNAHYKNSRNVASPEIGIGYGITSRWYTELSTQWIQFNGRHTRNTGIEWQNDFLLTQGQYDVDVALHTLVERSRRREDGYAVEIGPVLQAQFWRTQLNFNLFFQREMDNGEKNETELAYQWQVKQRWKSWFSPGLQGFGEVGKWNDWLPSKKQSHRAGPAFFGEAGHFKYEAAYLFGKNSGRAANSFSMRARYIF
ncbi:hypothetical protein SAMN05518865_10631 [Duganella sp. CF458]|uniref:hypothetical protein n=1 Tax=Duganella sp. CF458 TaxID=1884368 RepID=UPI0008EE480A|nr:hypothetical protein [Duganella sp. CF458]SFF91545.1 hypothetical protein SAMN05518865_10631 [Duganella sp. CF458]